MALGGDFGYSMLLWEGLGGSGALLGRRWRTPGRSLGVAGGTGAVPEGKTGLWVHKHLFWDSERAQIQALGELMCDK